MKADENGRRQTLGVDVGGTFTDLALWDGDNVRVSKVSTTTDDQSRGVIDRAEEVLPSTSAAVLLHGTTVATNALLERRGAKTLLVTDAGFESIIEIARQDRPSLYDAFADRAPPLVSPGNRIGVTITDATTDAELSTIVDSVVTAVEDGRIEALAICFLYSYEDPTHEERLRAPLAENLDIPISVSSEVVPEFREYERLSTTALNAFLSPQVRTYMGNLRRRAESIGSIGELAVMRSSGGLVSLEHASRFPSSILLSGPAGGVVATAALGELMNHDTLISFDMGGTSSDVCRVERGRPEVTYQREIDGYACLMPSVAVHTVGAGGGSIAWVDDGGALRVGPRSAGAHPGPACYGRGGIDPTVTDANLVLGRLDPEAMLADAVSLRADLAIDAFERLGQKVDLDPIEAAAGVLAVVESHMAHAIRAVSVEQGTDPRDAVLVAFGGAGGLHATALARELDMKSVVVPPHSGVFSAFGLLLSPPRADVGRTVNLTSDTSDQVARYATSLGREARRQLSTDSRQEAVAEALTVDMRYVGQSHETSVPYTLGESWDDLRRRYDRLHAQHNGFARPNDQVEAVTIRAEAVGSAALRMSDLPPFVASAESPLSPKRRLVVGPAGRATADVWWRPAMPAGKTISGPAVIEEDESTTFLNDGERATVHSTGALEITWQK